MLRAWCKQNKYVNNKNLSHVLMDGGSLSIPFEKLNDFYLVYLNAVQSREQLFVVEQKTEPFNFFIDIDYKDDEALTIEQIHSIVKIICDKVDTFFDNSKAIVSIAKPKPKDGQIKSGVHINWPGLISDCENANYLMIHIVNILNNVYSDKNWKTIIDSSVYGNPKKNTKGSGFRLPWSYKKGKHEQCKGKGCPGCQDTGKITEVPYLPLFLYEDQTLAEIDQDPTLERLWMATVRTDKTLDDVVKIPFVETSETSEVRPFKKEREFTASQTKNEFVNHELNAHLETFIRINMEGQSSSHVLKIFKNGNRYYVQTNSKYCENLKRSHSSNHIWFLIDDGKIAQKCFCTCETTEGRKKGYCKDFIGRSHNLSKTIVEILYPEKKLTNIRKLTLCPSLSLSSLPSL
jgi:hypothetical protein